MYTMMYIYSGMLTYVERLETDERECTERRVNAAACLRCGECEWNANGPFIEELKRRREERRLKEEAENKTDKPTGTTKQGVV